MLLQIIFVLLIARSVVLLNPGMKIGITQAGTNYAATVAIDVISKDITGKTLPDQSGTQHVTVGKVSYRVYNLKVNSFGRPSSSVVVNPTTDISWTLSGAATSISGTIHYKYKVAFIDISDTMDFDITVNNVGLVAGVHFGMSSDGQPTIQMTHCTSSVGGVDVHFHGGASWLYNLFSAALESPIRNALKNIMCESAKTAISNSASKALATLKLQFLVENIILFDCKMTEAPSIQSGYFETFHKGEMFWRSDFTEATFQPDVFPPDDHKQMVNIFISSYVMNTLGLVLHKHRLLMYKFSKSDLPVDNRDLLNTTCMFPHICIGSLIPQVGTLYPNSSVYVNARTLVPPVISIGPGILEGQFYGNMTYRALTPDGNDTYLFATVTNASFSLIPRLDGSVLKAKIADFKVIITVTDSAVGEIKSEGLTAVFGLLAKTFIIPQLNVFGEKGIQLPVIKDVAYTNPTLNFLQNAVILSTDVKYIGGW